MKFIVNIEETLSKEILIDVDSVDSKEKAINFIMKRYNNEEIVLDSSNFSAVEFTVKE